MHLLCNQPQIPKVRIQRYNMLCCTMISSSNGPGDALLSHPHLDGLIEGCDSPLDQVTDLLDLFRALNRAKQVSQQLDQLQTRTRLLQLLKSPCKRGKFHTRSLFLPISDAECVQVSNTSLPATTAIPTMSIPTHLHCDNIITRNRPTAPHHT